MYWHRKRGPRSAREIEDASLLDHIEKIHTYSRGTYGSPRVHAQLQREGCRFGRSRVERLMRATGLRGRIRRKYRKTTDSSHRLPIAPNLLNQSIQASKPDTTWVTDITYIKTGSGWLYPSVILDLHTRLIVGWALADNMRTELVEDALKVALGKRVPEEEMVHHSDRGSQYASRGYRAQLESRGIQVRMSRRGNCYDNAVAEGFFGTLKQELVHHVYWPSQAGARKALYDDIEVFYNRQRLHSSLGYRKPEEMDQEAARGDSGLVHTL